MRDFAYLAVAVNKDHTRASVVEMRCFRADLLTFAPFQQLAQGIAQLLVDCDNDRCPRYLDRANLTEAEQAELREECRLETLRRGIPSEDRPAYAARLWQERLQSLCLHEFMLGERSVASHLEQMSKSMARVCIARFQVERVNNENR